MRIVTLMENTKGKEGLVCEHGFSVYIEHMGHKVIMDAGASSLTWENAKALAIDPSLMDTLVLSHGHYDHSGGILSFLDKNPQARVYMRKSAGEAYYHGSGEGARYIGIDPKILETDRVVYIEEKGIYHLEEGMDLFSDIHGRRLWPQGNLQLKKKVGESFEQDTFDHEQCLVLKEKDAYILISGCAHNGILNILDRFEELYGEDPAIVISGFHMMKKEDYTEEEKQDILETAKLLKEKNTRYYTGHCTGLPAYALLKEVLGEQLQYAYPGKEICFK